MSDAKAIPHGAYVIPLSPLDTVLLGRITVIWAHIELAVDQLLRKLHGIDHMQFEEFFQDKMMGSKIAALKRSVERPQNALAKPSIRDFCALLEPLLKQRNHAVHGLWGFNVRKNVDKPIAAAHSHKRAKEPFEAGQLGQLHNDLAAASNVADDLCIKLLGFPARPLGGRKFFFGEGEPEEHSSLAPK